MNIELGQLPDGGLVLLADADFSHDVRRIEYYRDQRLMMLVYDEPEHPGELMHYELNDNATAAVEASGSILVVNKSPNRKLYGYDVPLVQVGAL